MVVVDEDVDWVEDVDTTAVDDGDFVRADETFVDEFEALNGGGEVVPFSAVDGALGVVVGDVGDGELPTGVEEGDFFIGVAGRGFGGIAEFEDDVGDFLSELLFFLSPGELLTPSCCSNC